MCVACSTHTPDFDLAIGLRLALALALGLGRSEADTGVLVKQYKYLQPTVAASCKLLHDAVRSADASQRASAAGWPLCRSSGHKTRGCFNPSTRIKN